MSVTNAAVLKAWVPISPIHPAPARALLCHVRAFRYTKTKKMLVLEITLDNENIVQDMKKYSEKDSFQINLSKKGDAKKINMTSFWKDIIRALRKKDN